MAISASLLPPIVNSGINLAYYFVRLSYPNATTPPAHDFLVISGYSFLLAFLNIVIIYLVAVIFFKVSRTSLTFLNIDQGSGAYPRKGAVLERQPAQNT